MVRKPVADMIDLNSEECFFVLCSLKWNWQKNIERVSLHTEITVSRFNIKAWYGADSGNITIKTNVFFTLRMITSWSRGLFFAVSKNNSMLVLLSCRSDRTLDMIQWIFMHY